MDIGCVHLCTLFFRTSAVQRFSYIPAHLVCGRRAKSSACTTHSDTPQQLRSRVSVRWVKTKKNAWATHCQGCAMRRVIRGAGEPLPARWIQSNARVESVRESGQTTIQKTTKKHFLGTLTVALVSREWQKRIRCRSCFFFSRTVES